MATTEAGRPLFAALLLPVPGPWPRPCPECGGRGVTGDRYEMPTDGPTLLCDVICPACRGCGNGDPDHEACPADLHAWDDDDDFDLVDDEPPPCPSCGSGRGWNPVQGVTGDPLTSPDPLDAVVVLRVPCGCSADRLTIGPDPAALVLPE
jgi:hypothetical protein